MRRLTSDERTDLINDIALRAGTASELCKWYEIDDEQLRAFVNTNRAVIEEVRDRDGDESTPIEVVAPATLQELWISKKTERLTRYQLIADALYTHLMLPGGLNDNTLLREFRSYLRAGAEELGQLLHRGSDSDTGDVVNYSFGTVDMDALK